MNRWNIFCNFIEKNLGTDARALTDFLATPTYTTQRGIRFNPARALLPHQQITDALQQCGIHVESSIPWEPLGYSHSCATLGSHFLHHAGAFYIQEPSAMLPASLLPLHEGGVYLDLCAAPGGKTSQICGRAIDQKLNITLVANETVASRHAVLTSNLERLGLLSYVCPVNFTPDTLALELPAYFDGILVDAPCSGEGMFGRDPLSIDHWSPEHVESCAQRQLAILRSAVALLRPGGHIVYSTCTVNSIENEAVVAWFLHEFPEFSSVTQEPPAGTRAGIDGIGLRIWPQDGSGDGQYCALLQHGSNSPVPPLQNRTPMKRAKTTAPTSTEQSLLSEVTTGEWVQQEKNHLHKVGDTLFWLPPAWRTLPIAARGIALGKIRGQQKISFLPSHTLAMLDLPTLHTHYCKLTEQEVIRYIQGHPLQRDIAPATGWKIACALEGAPLGWIKWHANGEGKNHLPSGLYMRRPMNFAMNQT
ncbi:methyltransferase RsmF C-terminal domain-like protein [Chrysiogenes arsenatis]|uniref:methyltransferase RsmF C-terminal domain-like protein n=1 Tax=Chrysiogenes arsenatis TaxID=309797 RepID=UPI0003FC76F2|nr:hypothetical protein [Chrysiogenes arsenatis]